MVREETQIGVCNLGDSGKIGNTGRANSTGGFTNDRSTNGFYRRPGLCKPDRLKPVGYFFSRFQSWRIWPLPALEENSFGRSLPGGAKQTLCVSPSSS